MVLRKCPACKETVGAETEVYPRCGVSFRAALARIVVMWIAAAALLTWGIAHFMPRRL